MFNAPSRPHLSLYGVPNNESASSPFLHPGGTHLLQMTAAEKIKVSDSSDRKLFDAFERKLRSHFHATSVAILDGLDQAYHDLQIENTVITLHLEQYSGASISLRYPDGATKADLDVLERIHEYVLNPN